MKLLSIAVPCYNSQDYMAHAIDSLLSVPDTWREQLEILVVNDGSTDRTAEIADDYQRRYPGIVRTIHQKNGGHGGAVMTGLRHATGRYFKVVDSDDWLDEAAFPRVLEKLSGFSAPDNQIDLFLCNYIYDKVGVRHKYVMRYNRALPEDRVFGWAETRRFRLGQYFLMHSMIYRSQLLRECGLWLPRHTFYVDELYAYVPLQQVRTMYYMNADLYHYFIGREDQSIQEDVMIRRIDQALKVNRLMVTEVDLNRIANRHQRNYMRNYLEIITNASSVLLTKSGTQENQQKKQELWRFIREHNPSIYHELRHRLLGRLIHLPGVVGRNVTLLGYRVTQKIWGFN